MSDRCFICFDTEATGLTRVQKKNLIYPGAITTKGAEVCQIGGLILDKYMQPVRLFCYYCDTVVAGSKQAAFEVHGINAREVRSSLPAIFLPEVLERYLPEFFYPDSVFIGYNAMFDMDMVSQTIANSPLSFEYKQLFAQIIPKTGRYVIDVAEYLKLGSTYRRLTSFENEVAPKRDAFLRDYANALHVETNCIDLLSGTWERAHNAFFDALNTYILWGDKIWRKKVV